MTLTSVLAEAQQRVDNDKNAMKNGNAAAADLAAAQAVLDSVTEVQTITQAQSGVATSRLSSAKSAATTANGTISSLEAQFAAAPFNLTAPKEKKLNDAVDATTFDADFDNVQASIAQLVTNNLDAGQAHIDLEASQKKVRVLVNAVLQWVAVAESAMAQVQPLLQRAATAIAAKDLATAWWAVAQAKTYLDVVNDANTTSNVTTAISDLTKQADDFATKLDDALQADAAVAAEQDKLAQRQAALAATAKATGTALAALVQAGL